MAELPLRQRIRRHSSRVDHPVDVAAPGPTPNGGNWGRCALHFTPTGRPSWTRCVSGCCADPRTACGRYRPRRRRRTPVSATRLAFQAEAGDCYRLVVVGGQGAGSIEAEACGFQGAPAGGAVGTRALDAAWTRRSCLRRAGGPLSGRSARGARSGCRRAVANALSLDSGAIGRGRPAGAELG